MFLLCHSRHRALPRAFPGCTITRFAARLYSDRCCGMPASSARTSVSRYRRCPPSVRMEVSFPALAHRVTVFGSTRNMVATSAGVSRGSASGVRADMLTASPPGPVLRSCVYCCAWAPLGSLPWMSHMVYSDHIAITSGDKSTTRSKRFFASLPRLLHRSESRCVILATRSVATGRFGKVIPPSPQLPSSTASNSRHLARSRWYMAAASSNSLFPRALTAADTSATDWSARSASSSSSWTNPP